MVNFPSLEKIINYENKCYLNAKNRKVWVDKFHDEAVKKV